LKDKSIGLIKWLMAGLEHLLGRLCIKRRIRRSAITVRSLYGGRGNDFGTLEYNAKAQCTPCSWANSGTSSRTPFSLVTHQ